MQQRLGKKIGAVGGALVVLGGVLALPGSAMGSTRASASTPRVRIRAGSGYFDATANCMKGEQVTGGGAATVRGWGFQAFYPNSTNGWYAAPGQYDGTVPTPVTKAYAVCEKTASARKVVVRQMAGPIFYGYWGAISTVTASCNPGEQALGGGGSAKWESAPWNILTSEPESMHGHPGVGAVATKWRVDVGNQLTGSGGASYQGVQLMTFVVCERSNSAPKVVIRRARHPADQLGYEQTTSVTASCKSGEQAVGGGGYPTLGWFEMQASVPETSKGRTTPGGIPTKWKVTFVNYSNTIWSTEPTAYVMCEQQ